MTKLEICENLNNIIREVVNNEKITVSESTVISDIEGWDSFLHLSFIAAVEIQLGIKFSMNETYELYCIGDIINLIERKAK